jgi:dihydrolipoamide dehydrogenase
MDYDLIVIGGGPAGYTAAIRAAQLGLKTACIEKRGTLGGTCLNVGCIPSKALLDSSEHFFYARTKLQKHGVLVGDVKLDLEAMMKRKDTVVRQLAQGIAGLFKKHKIDWINGHGRLLSAKGAEKTVEINDSKNTPKTLTAKKILLCTGSQPIELPFLKFDSQRVVSSTEALSLPKVPAHLVVIGGGVIGLELGSVWSRLGAKVTVIEFSKKFLAALDTQAASELYKALVKQGLEFKFGTKCTGATPQGERMLVSIEDVETGAKSTLEGDVILVATGRKPYSEGLGLEENGIERDKIGRVQVDSHFQTACPGVYAVGDLIAGPMLAHKAEEEGVAAVEIIAGQAGHVHYPTIPGVIYTWPEFAWVGQSEDELKSKGIAVKTGVFPFLASGRARAMEESEGIVKIIADARTDRVLGVHIVGPRASDLIAEAVTVMEYGGSSEDIARTSHAHPTLSEVMKEAALAVDKMQRNL